MKARALTACLLLGGALASLGGWQLQESAAQALRQARILQEAEVPSEGGKPPSAESNRKIIENLERGIAIRKEIDDVLTRVRASVARLGRSQAAASRVAERTRRLLVRVAGTLGGSVESARRSLSRLEALADRLRNSQLIGRAITRELAELDRSMGPSVGEP